MAAEKRPRQARDAEPLSNNDELTRRTDRTAREESDLLGRARAGNSRPCSRDATAEQACARALRAASRRRAWRLPKVRQRTRGIAWILELNRGSGLHKEVMPTCTPAQGPALAFQRGSERGATVRIRGRSTVESPRCPIALDDWGADILAVRWKCKSHRRRRRRTRWLGSCR